MTTPLPTVTPESSDDSSDDDNNNALVVAAIVVGIIIFIVAHVILVVVIIWYRWNKNRQTLRISGKYDVTEVKAVVVPSNGLPVDEHQSNGKQVEDEKQFDHIPVVDDNQVKTFCVYKMSLYIVTRFSYMC